MVVVAAPPLFLEERLPQLMRDRSARILRERFESEVEFGRICVSVFPRIKISGEDLALRHKRPDRRSTPDFL